MTQEEKDLLVKDLSARLPYRVICNVQDGKINKDYVLTGIHANGYGFDNKYGVFYGSESFVVKPYLRPMSSMTEEEKKYIKDTFCATPWGSIQVFGSGEGGCSEVDVEGVVPFIIWLLKNHFDFMGLIPKGLAIEVTEENNPYKD